MTSRRKFIRNSALTVASASLLSNRLFASNKANEIVGVQLYSVRDDMGKDPMGTLRKIAAIGY